MESFILSLQVVGPLFLLMAIGAILKRIKLLDDKTVSQMSSVTFKFFLSAQTFNNIYGCNIVETWNGKEVLINVLLMIANFILAIIIARNLSKDDRKYASLTQGMFQNSYITFGVPMVSAAYGSNSVGMVSLMSALIVPIKNVLVVGHMSTVCNKKKNAKDLMLNVMKNPFFLGGFLGFAINLAGIQLPVIIEDTVTNLAKAATPMALLLLGASISLNSLKEYRVELIWGVLMKMLFIPGVLIIAAVILKLRGPSLLSTLIMLAAPSATSAHIMAKEMGADSELARQMTVLTSTLSSLTLFMFIFVLKLLGYL